jgi:uncharacterized membrane protein
VRQASVAGLTTLLAALVSAVVLLLMLYRGLAEPEAGDTVSLDPVGWAILISAFACLAVSIILVAYSRFLGLSLEPAPEEPGLTPSDGEVTEASTVREEPESRDLSRLPEDERRLYEIIEVAGGEILQMRLVSSGEFSKSKVTRLLDKLENRGLIKRERHGMTNMVKLVK